MAEKPRKKRKRATKAKPAADMTDAEVLRKLFPKKVRETIKRETEEAERRAKKFGSGGHDDQS